MSLRSDYVSFHRASAEVLTHLVDSCEAELSRKAGPEVARKAMSYVMRAYRAADLLDPAAFVDFATQAIEDYPALTVGRLASPKIGIVRTNKFPPAIAEFVSWCEADVAKMREAISDASTRIGLIRRSEETAKQKLEQAAEREKKQREWVDGEPARKAAEAKEIEKMARYSLQKMQEDARISREREARAAWTKFVFAAVAKEDADVVNQACSFSDEDQEKATQMELASPGSGGRFLLAKISKAQQKDTAE